MLGGYRIINMLGTNFVGAESHVIPGIYKKMEECIGKKPIVVSNFVRNGIEQIPVFSGARITSTGEAHIFLYTAGNASNSFYVDSSDQVRWVISVPAASQADEQAGEDGPSASV